MVHRITGGIPVLEFELLHAEKDLVHFVTTRSGGCSNHAYSSLNLSRQVGDLPENVEWNRSKVRDAFGILPGRMHYPEQCHANYVQEVTDETGPDDLARTDALITNRKNQCIAVLAADCVPVLFYDPNVRAVGVAHAGWKGTIGRIAIRTIEQMVRTYASKPQQILACIGPSISQKYYEVGNEVVVQFEFWFADTPAVFHRNPHTGKTHINLWEANRQLLLRAGLQACNIEVSRICTYNSKDHFYSARRDGFTCGRFATAIMLT
jgi:YfiH family protein